MDSVTRLRLALTATRPGAKRGLVKRVRRDGPAVLAALFEGLSPDQQLAIGRQAEELDRRDVCALVYGAARYPQRLRGHPDAPVALFYRGPVELLDRPTVGVCGSRNASDQGLRAASACGEVAAEEGIVSVSGYARGVDMAAHIASLRAGGATVIVVPDGIDRFRRRRAIADVWDNERALVVSQFAPAQPWTVGGAMARNSVIIGLSAALVVVEAGESGGTLAAGSRALDRGQKVWTMQTERIAAGNRLLLDRGAVAVGTRAELTARLSGLHSDENNPGAASGLFDLEVAPLTLSART